MLVEFLDENSEKIGEIELDEAHDKLLDEFSELRYALKEAGATQQIRIENQVFDSNITNSLRSVGGFGWAREFVLERLGFVIIEE